MPHQKQISFTSTMPQEQIDAIIKQHKEALLMEIIERLFLTIDIAQDGDTITYTLTENT